MLERVVGVGPMAWHDEGAYIVAVVVLKVDNKIKLI